jgi:hypothetical protein
LWPGSGAQGTTDPELGVEELVEQSGFTRAFAAGAADDDQAG